MNAVALADGISNCCQPAAACGLGFTCCFWLHANRFAACDAKRQLPLPGMETEVVSKHTRPSDVPVNSTRCRCLDRRAPGIRRFGRPARAVSRQPGLSVTLSTVCPCEPVSVLCPVPPSCHGAIGQPMQILEPSHTGTTQHNSSTPESKISTPRT